jgi:hypothetical protein
VTSDNCYSGDLVSFTAVNESDDVAQIFMDELKKDVKRWYERTKFPKNMVFTDHDKKVYSEADVYECAVCSCTGHVFLSSEYFAN